jgi:two-component system, cell cycle response regulator DivK
MSRVDISNWKVLVVDDELDNLNLLEDILSFFDAQVVSSHSGEDAIKLLDQQAFALALIDIQMPGVSGWDLIRHIRSSDKPELRNLVVIGVTAHAMPGDRERVLNAGFDGYISKPIEPETFVDSVMDIVHNHQNPQQSQQSDENALDSIAETPFPVENHTLIQYQPQQSLDSVEQQNKAASVEQQNKAASDTRENPAVQQ